MAMLATVVYNLHQPGECQRSVVLPSVMSSMASNSPTMSRCGSAALELEQALGEELTPAIHEA